MRDTLVLFAWFALVLIAFGMVGRVALLLWDDLDYPTPAGILSHTLMACMAWAALQYLLECAP